MRSKIVIAPLIVLGLAVSEWSDESRVILVSRAPFRRVEKSITDHNMALVGHADARCGATARSVTIKGTQGMTVFRNDFAVRILAAGVEAPIRIYRYENPDGTAEVGARG